MGTVLAPWDDVLDSYRTFVAISKDARARMANVLVMGTLLFPLSTSECLRNCVFVSLRYHDRFRGIDVFVFIAIMVLLKVHIALRDIFSCGVLLLCVTDSFHISFQVHRGNVFVLVVIRSQ